MNKRRRDPVRIFLWLDLILNCFALAGTAAVVYEVNQSLSFTGFGGLFALVLLTPHAAASFGAVILLLAALWDRKRRGVFPALFLQMIGPLLWLMMAFSLQSAASWLEAVMTVQIAAGAAGLMLLSISKQQ